MMHAARYMHLNAIYRKWDKSFIPVTLRHQWTITKTNKMYGSVWNTSAPGGNNESEMAISITKIIGKAAMSLSLVSFENFSLVPVKYLTLQVQ